MTSMGMDAGVLKRVGKMRTVRVSRVRRGFTAMEVIVVMLIIAICTSIACDTVAEFEASARPERAARECLIAFQYARHYAMTTGAYSRVTFDTTNQTFSVSSSTDDVTFTAVAYPLTQAGGNYTINLTSASELRGTTISLSPAATTAYTYNGLGNLDSAGIVSFSYGGKTRTLNVYRAGDPRVN